MNHFLCPDIMKLFVTGRAQIDAGWPQMIASKGWASACEWQLSPVFLLFSFLSASACTNLSPLPNWTIFTVFALSPYWINQLDRSAALLNRGVPSPSPSRGQLAQPLAQGVSLMEEWGHTADGQEAHGGLYFSVVSQLRQENALWRIHWRAAPLGLIDVDSGRGLTPPLLPKQPVLWNCRTLSSGQCWVSSFVLLHNCTGSNQKG